MPEEFLSAEDVTRTHAVSGRTFTCSGIVSKPLAPLSDTPEHTVFIFGSAAGQKIVALPGFNFPPVNPALNGAELMSRAVNVLALVRDGQRYVFMYDDNSVETVLAQLAEFANDPELDFTWYDAAMLSQRVRHLQAEEEEARTEDFPSFF